MREIDKEILKIELDFKDTLNNEIAQSKQSETEIKDIIYVGDIEWKDRINGNNLSEKLFIVKKEITLKNEKGEEIEKKTVNNYYLGDKCIGGFMDVKSPIFNQYIETAEPEKIKKVKELLQNTPIEELENKSMENLQKQYIKELSEKLGISEEEIMQIDEVDLNEELPTEEEVQEKLNTKETKDTKQKRIGNEELEKLDIREETKLNQEIKGETLGQKLGLDKAGIHDGEKLVRIQKSQLSSKTREGISSQSVDILAVTRKDGSAVILGENILRPNTREGTNPTQENATIDNNDGTIDKEVNTTSYEIVNGNGREYINIGYDEVSGKEIKYSMYSHQEGKYIDVELETNRTLYQDPKVREFLRDRNEGMHEADEIINTYSKENLQNMARMILENTENGISEVYNQADVERKIIEKIRESGYDKDNYQSVIEEVEQEMEESAKGQIVRGDMSQ